MTHTVGQSQPAKDWYYAQSVLPMEDGSCLSPKWNVWFALPPVEPEKMLLTVDLAGAAGGDNHLMISVNDQGIGQIRSPNDSGIYRSAVRSADFRHNAVEFDSSMLHPGTNTVSFVLRSQGNWGHGDTQSVITTAADQRPELPPSGVTYNCIQLESDAVVGDGSCRATPR